MDDQLTRRRVVWLLSATAAIGCATRGVADDTTAGVAPEPTGDCDATRAQTQGPFYPGEPVARTDITESQPGVPLALDITVVRSGSCEPVAGAEVDVWCANASGDYSGYAAFGTDGEDWLRGQQVTDAAGVAAFAAIVPGSYPGRAVHLHVKVRRDGLSELTTQIYLPDAVVAEVLARGEYGGSAAQTNNAADGIFVGDTVIEVAGDVASGLTGAITLAM